jgi:hypothetical protein
MMWMEGCNSEIIKFYVHVDDINYHEEEDEDFEIEKDQDDEEKCPRCNSQPGCNYCL